MDLADIIINANKTPGFGSVMYIVPFDNIDTFPDPAASTNLVSTAFTIKLGSAGFVKVPVSTVPGKTIFSQEKSGDVDNPIRNDTLNAFHAGSDPVTSFELSKLNSTECIVLLREKKECNTAGDPLYQMVGNKCQGVFVTATYNNGDNKGYTLTGEAFATSLPLYYDAAIPA